MEKMDICKSLKINDLKQNLKKISLGEISLSVLFLNTHKGPKVYFWVFCSIIKSNITTITMKATGSIYLYLIISMVIASKIIGRK